MKKGLCATLSTPRHNRTVANICAVCGVAPSMHRSDHCRSCRYEQRRTYWRERCEARDIKPVSIDVLYTAAQVRARWGSWRRVLIEEAA